MALINYAPTNAYPSSLMQSPLNTFQATPYDLRYDPFIEPNFIQAYELWNRGMLSRTRFWEHLMQTQQQMQMSSMIDAGYYGGSMMMQPFVWDDRYLTMPWELPYDAPSGMKMGRRMRKRRSSWRMRGGRSWSPFYRDSLFYREDPFDCDWNW